MSDNNSSSGGVGLCGLLFVAFMVLKLCGVIGWSWWWVAAPLWIPAAIALMVLLVIAAVTIIGLVVAWRGAGK
ncbi:MAG: hypothetical protein GY851_29045 [bacterium]|nr:hypothetical protein [bacterium]